MISIRQVLSYSLGMPKTADAFTAKPTRFIEYTNSLRRLLINVSHMTNDRCSQHVTKLGPFTENHKVCVSHTD
jgi:hypothetical protein